MGFTFLVAQGLLIRELLVIFRGNELSIGIILANWLILEAIGSSLLGRMADKVTSKIEVYTALQLLLSIFLPIAIYMTRTIKGSLGFICGEEMGLLSIFYSSFLILAPLSLIDGAMFSFGCKMHSSLMKEQAPSIGKVYIYEAIGAILGGITFTYLFIPHFHSIQIAIGIAILNLFSASLLLFSSMKISRPLMREKTRYSYLFIICITFIALIFYLSCSSKVNMLHIHSLGKQWEGQELKHYQNSVYGNIAVTKRGEQYTFFTDGIPLFSTPVPNINFVEELVHLPMLFHPLPKKLLLISGGTGGILNEILKHPVEKIDYTELDSLLIEVIRKFATPLIERELNHPKVKIKYVDGRFLITKSREKYDIIIINLPPPSTLQLNRFYTEEFFQKASKILTKNGILVVTLPGSLTYLSEELRNLNTCIYQTLKTIFPHIYIIPGDFNLFLSSPSPYIFTVGSDTLIQRFKKRSLQSKFLTDFHIKYKLDKNRLYWFSQSLMEEKPIRINKDLFPSSLFYYLSYWNTLFSPKFRSVFKLIGKVNLQIFFAPLIIFTLILLFVRRYTPKFKKTSIPTAITFTGFAGMVFNIVIILTFQSLYGCVYQKIAFIIATFMVGLTAGGITMIRIMKRTKEDMSLLAKIESLILLYSMVLPMLLIFLHSSVLQSPISTPLQTILFILNMTNGFLVGLEFPLANKIYLSSTATLGKEENRISYVAGTLYACDLLGAWMGALLASIILIPILGILTTCILVAMFKISSLILVITHSAIS